MDNMDKKPLISVVLQLHIEYVMLKALIYIVLQAFFIIFFMIIFIAN